MNVVEVRVHGLVVENKTQQHVVVLQELGGTRILPIWIGPAEAAAIQRMLSDETFPRPLTHDLIALVVEGLKARVTRVVIADLRENTFFATLFIEREKDMLKIDARPSDSIAVALRAKAPLFVNDQLLQEPSASQQGLDDPSDMEPSSPPPALTQEEKAEQLRRFLEKLDPEDFGKFQM
ncbi:MAG: bifunctional nuclease family protein [Candidatus Eisenbacteria bacterium]